MRRLTSEETAQLSPFTLAIYDLVLDVLDGNSAGVFIEETSSFITILDDTIIDSRSAPEPQAWHYVVGKLHTRQTPLTGIAICFGECPKMFDVFRLKKESVGTKLSQVKRDHYKSDEAFLQDIKTELRNHLQT